MRDILIIGAVMGGISLIILAVITGIIFATIKIVKCVILESIDKATEEDPGSDKE